MKTRTIAQYILAVLIVLCFFSLIAILIFVEMPKNNGELLYLAIGALISSFGTVKDYFFGSSAGSAAKTELMSKQKEDEKT